MKIWALDDGKPGHWSMTEGLVRMIGAARATEVTRVRVEWRWGSARHVLQRLARWGVTPPSALVRASVRMEPVFDGAAAPDLVVSRGGATLFVNGWLARRTGAANVFIGKIRQMPPSWFRAVILRQDDRLEPPFFPLPLFPTRIDPRSLDAKAAEFPWTQGRPSGPVASLLIGGDGSGYQYAEADWAALAEGMATWHRRHGVRWCVTTSRRTDPRAEELILEKVPAEALHEAVWWHRGDRRPCMVPFIAVAEQVFCTEDSMSMLEEVISGGRRLIGLSPKVATPNPNFRGFLARRVEAGRMRRLSLEKFAEGGPDYPWDARWNLVGPDEMETGVRRLVEYLKL